MVYAGMKIRKGSKIAIGYCFIAGMMMMLFATFFMLGFPMLDKFYWHDIPGFRVVYGAFFMLAALQTAVSGIAWTSREAIRY